MDLEKNSQELIEALDLQPFTEEFGRHRRVFESERFDLDGERKPWAHNSIYHILSPDFPINYLHRLSADDTLILCQGGSGYSYLFHPDSSVEHSVLGQHFQQGEQFCLVISACSWKALQLRSKSAFALMVTVVILSHTRDRIEIGAGQEFVGQYSDAIA